MSTRQVILLTTSLAFLAVLSARLPPTEISPTQTVVPTTVTVTATLPPSPVPATFTPTPLACLTEPGLVKQDVAPTANPAQQFTIYLPPCYENSADARFPVLYLLHGQTYNQDQWVRIGAPTIADQLIHSDQAMPFIMVFPDDRYSNSTFDNRLMNILIPYVDGNYRTIPDRKHRALGGLSRGGGLTVEFGFAHPELFGALGLHSPAVLKENAPFVERYIQAIPQETRPKVWFDIGDADMELARGLLLEDILTRNDYIHEFYRFAGDHTEKYWNAHLEKYLRWYTQNWQQTSAEQ